MNKVKRNQSYNKERSYGLKSIGYVKYFISLFHASLEIQFGQNDEEENRFFSRI